MYVSRENLAKLGLLPPNAGCCGSCHADAENGYAGGEMMGVYEDEVKEGGKWDTLAGDICCAIAVALDVSGDKESRLRKCYEAGEIEVLK